MRHRRRESSPLKAPQGSSLKNSIFLEKIQFGPELNNNTERDRPKEKNIHNDGEEKMYMAGRPKLFRSAKADIEKVVISKIDEINTHIFARGHSRILVFNVIYNIEKA